MIACCDPPVFPLNPTLPRIIFLVMVNNESEVYNIILQNNNTIKVSNIFLNNFVLMRII